MAGWSLMKFWGLAVYIFLCHLWATVSGDASACHVEFNGGSSSDHTLISEQTGEILRALRRSFPTEIHAGLVTICGPQDWNCDFAPVTTTGRNFDASVNVGRENRTG